MTAKKCSLKVRSFCSRFSPPRVRLRGVRGVEVGGLHPTAVRPPATNFFVHSRCIKAMVVHVLQTDNRPSLDYLQQTMKVNQHYSKMNDYRYIFKEMKVVGDFHPALYKIMVVNEFLSANCFEEDDILIFLDSDAWIFNPVMLTKLLVSFPSSKHGVFSRDPYAKSNTYINSGSFIIRINEHTKEMYSTLEKQAREDRSYSWKWPYDQWYISNYIYKHRDKFVICKPDIVNTPIGKIIRHSWIKNFSTCHVQEDHSIFDLSEYIDEECFPNTLEHAYCWTTHLPQP